MVRYDGGLVKKAVHLVRDPFDNVMARFHHEYKLSTKRNEDFVKQHDYDESGALKWCQGLNDRFEKQELEWFEVMKDFMDVPCRSEFFKYVQWHNHAIFTVKQMEIDTLVVHYKDFHDDFDKTVTNLMNFLELEIEDVPPKFFYHTYPEVFTPKQVERIWEFMTAVADDDTKALISGYRYKTKEKI
eukprot:CAMPEP_0172496432 /NCGR_PEP_ID=MMETSP1066-20121228/87319_1 /TAXON_ID=671091 /ORGANISM="Coscinodiscus wailesii, Strain CCMP2513" /LENGTH=185 /DNA_ID=CAMNT_0013268739 /DNA_START=594 /DNA_END=1151 /DNA_ORIENTATION=+